MTAADPRPEYVTPIEPATLRRSAELLGLPGVATVADAVERDGRYTLRRSGYDYTWVRMDPPESSA